MGFKFSFLCDLLSNLEANRTLKSSTTARGRNPDIRTITNWFRLHERRIHDKDTDLLALLSCFFPEKRTDRVYWLQDASLARVIGRCLLLGISRREELDNWRVSGGGDLGQCVENVMQQAENYIPNGQEVTVEDIDAALEKIASRCRFSGPRVRRQHTAVDVEETLGPLYRRLSSRDAKWLTRMILKSYYPVMLPVKFLLQNVHFLLPHLLLFQDSFEAAVGMLRTSPLNCFQSRPEPGVAKLLSENAVQYLNPRIGIKVGRPDFYKARSIKHCCQMVGRRRMSLERKYDGEYCQIHVDLSKQPDCIRIFSKSGKDSTVDRIGIHKVLKQSLGIGRSDCNFSRRCILEGELLVWSDREEKILEFHRLRKFVCRSGTFIGTDNDSQPRPYEHLMIMFFDILLLDDNICLTKPHRERRLLLKKIVNLIPGRAGIAEQQIIDFSRHDSRDRLERAFSKGIAERWEGYVLKSCDDPYFPILSSGTDVMFGRWIKLKKDYIPGLGDTVDLALVGGRYNPRDATAMEDITRLSWTHFHIGCLENKDAVSQFHAKPKFRVVDVIDRHCLNAKDMQLLNRLGQFRACEPDSNTAFDVQKGHTGLPDLDTVFKTPFVVEVLGSGFDKPSNAGYFTLRFPRVLKIHSDRSFEEAVSFAKLQNLAEKARSVPADELSQERISWRRQLEATNGMSEYIVDRSQSTSISCSTPSAAAISPSSRQASGPCPTASWESPLKVIPGTSPLLGRTPNHLPSSLTRHSAKRGLPCDLRDASESLPCKKRKGSNASEQAIVIFTDNTQASSPTRQDSPISNHLLTCLDNVQPQKNDTAANMTSHRDSLAGLSVQDENSTQNHIDPVERHDAPEVKENDALASTGYTTAVVSARVAEEDIELTDMDLALDELCPIEIDLQSPLVTIPIYIGRFFFKSRGRLLPMERFFRAQAREFTFAACHFVEELGFTRTRNTLSDSNPAAVSDDIALGIVLIDLERPEELLNDALTISNEVANTLSSNWPEIPSKGKIFMLDWRVLRQGTGVEDRRFCLRETWRDIAHDHLHGCILWGYGLTPEEEAARNAEAEQLRKPDDAWSWETDSTPSEDKRVGTDVHTSWDITLLQDLGEFLSISPLIHVNGQLCTDTENLLL